MKLFRKCIDCKFRAAAYESVRGRLQYGDKCVRTGEKIREPWAEVCEDFTPNSAWEGAAS